MGDLLPQRSAFIARLPVISPFPFLAVGRLKDGGWCMKCVRTRLTWHRVDLQPRRHAFHRPEGELLTGMRAADLNVYRSSLKHLGGVHPIVAMQPVQGLQLVRCFGAELGEECQRLAAVPP